MSTGLSREILKWLLSLNLSYPVKNMKRDFCNGFLIAEILSRYYPADVQMHSFENVTSVERKKSNWSLLEKVFKKRQIQVERKHIEALMNADGDSAAEVLEILHQTLNNADVKERQGSNKTASSSSSVGEPGYRDPPYNPGDFHPAPSAMAWPMLANGQHQHAPTQQHPSHSPDMHMHQQHPGQVPQHQQPYGSMPRPQHSPQLQNPYSHSPQQHHQYAQSQPQEPHYHHQHHPQYPPAQQPPQYGGTQYAGGYPGEQYAQLTPLEQQHLAMAQMMQAQMIQAQYASSMGMVPGSPDQAHGMAPMAPPMLMAPGRQPQQQQQHPAPGGKMRPKTLAPIPSSNGRISKEMVQPAATPPEGEQHMAAMMAMYGMAPQNVQLPPVVRPKDQGNGRKAKQVEYQPYSQRDFDEKNYNVKKMGNYWELGRLGPDLETPELQAKREKVERIKEMAKEIHASNQAKLAASKPKVPLPKEPTARDRAREFSRNVPKPEARRLSKQNSSVTSAEPSEAAEPMSELEALELQHQLDAQRVAAMSSELDRLVM